MDNHSHQNPVTAGLLRGAESAIASAVLGVAISAGYAKLTGSSIDWTKTAQWSVGAGLAIGLVTGGKKAMDASHENTMHQEAPDAKIDTRTHQYKKAAVIPEKTFSIAT